MPGENKIGFNTTEMGDKPYAVWWNLNGGWSYHPRAHQVKSSEAIVRAFLEAQRRKATFMVNVGPRPWGDIHPEEQQALRDIGRLLKSYLG
jgi:alpha-L-fucosidase